MPRQAKSNSTRQISKSGLAGIGGALLLIGLTALAACAPTSPMIEITGIPQPLSPGDIFDTRAGRKISFEQLIAQLRQARVVYVGERHTDAAHHAIQLKILRALAEDGRRPSVGMEMFDHTYQHVLDQWSAGGMDWPTFLKRTHWYANWKFDDLLYKDILDYIQSRRLRLIGLNIPMCIPPRIAVGGLNNLCASDRAELPEQIDITNAAHRAYVQKIFSMHKIKGRQDFENFYAAQCAWEDGMAKAVADHLGRDSMVVLAGNGHIERKFGIPERAFKRSQAPFLTVYPAPAIAHAKISRAVGDFIWVTPAAAPMPGAMP